MMPEQQAGQLNWRHQRQPVTCTRIVLRKTHYFLNSD
jgi:hypothetical protein